MQRKPTHRQRHRLEHAITLYLKYCYRRRTVVRVSELAQLLGLSVAHLSRIAAQAFGMPLRDYLRRRQLQEAERILRTTPMKTTLVGRNSGFGTVASFYRCFRRAYGTSPGAFREINK